MNAKQRFWASVDVGTADACWEWTASRDRDGYGKFYDRGYTRGHRFSWQLHYGAIPDGLCVLHRCDNPSCVNPQHLFLGTVSDNNKDCASKGRAKNGSRTKPERLARGERVNTAKLTAGAVREIRQRYASEQIGQRALAHHYGVSRSMIQFIVNGSSWRHVQP